MCADFNFYLNRQGVRGVQGVKGDDGFSPVITVAQDNADGYKLHIQTATDDFDTSNLRPPITDAGGKYLLWDNTTGTMTAGFLDYASTEVVGGVNLATAEDMTEGENTQVVPSVRVVADYVAGKLEENSGTISNTITQSIYENINTASGDSNIVITKNTGSEPAGITDIAIGLNNNLTNISQLKGKNTENIISIDVPTVILFRVVDSGEGLVFKDVALDTIINQSQGALFRLQDGGQVISGISSGGTAYRYAVGAPAVWVTYPSDTQTHFLLDESALANGGGLSITNNNTTQKMSLAGIPEQDTIRPTVTIGVNTDNNTIKINEQGQLYADVQAGEVSIATTSTAGIVKPDGTTITVDADGTISAVGGTSGGDVTAAGNNMFTGTNAFMGDVTFGGNTIIATALQFGIGLGAGHIQNSNNIFSLGSESEVRIAGKYGSITIDSSTTSTSDKGIHITPISTYAGNVYIGTASIGVLKVSRDSVTYTKSDSTEIDLLNPAVDLSEINSQISAMQADITAIEQQIGNIVTRLNEINGEDV